MRGRLGCAFILILVSGAPERATNTAGDRIRDRFDASANGAVGTARPTKLHVGGPTARPRDLGRRRTRVDGEALVDPHAWGTAPRHWARSPLAGARVRAPGAVAGRRRAGTVSDRHVRHISPSSHMFNTFNTPRSGIRGEYIRTSSTRLPSPAVQRARRNAGRNERPGRGHRVLSRQALGPDSQFSRY